MNYSEITNAIEEAMTDFIENGEATPHRPAIMRDCDGYYYGSALHGDEIVVDLDDGFGSYQPELREDVAEMAAAFAKTI